MEYIVKKIVGLDADDILKLLTLDEVPTGHREEVWIGKSGTNYYVGSDGIMSDNGEIIEEVE
jgi:hypothetical protein